MRHKLHFPFLHINEALLPFIQLCAPRAVGFTKFVFLNALQEQAPEVVGINGTRLMFSQYGSSNSIQFKFPCILRGQENVQGFGIGQTFSASSLAHVRSRPPHLEVHVQTNLHGRQARCGAALFFSLLCRNRSGLFIAARMLS